MMDCSAYKELWGLRQDDISEQECRDLQGHLDRCETCRREQQGDLELLSVVDRWPSLESHQTAADVWRRDGLDPASMQAASAPPRSAHRPGLRLPLLLAVAAAATLAMIVLPRWRQPQPPPGHRLKAVDAPTAPASVDLQFSVESQGLAGVAVTAGAGGEMLAAEDALAFGVRVDGVGGVTLVEEGPGDGLRVVVTPGSVAWRADDGGLATLIDGAGAPMVYRPDDMSGTYRYQALLTAPPDRALDDHEVERLLRGEDVAGVSLLASDSFEVEWQRDAALDGTQ